MEESFEKKIRVLLSDIFDIDEEEITDGTAPENVALWDSLNHLTMATGIEKLFDIKLAMKEIRSMVSFAMIIETVGNHIAEKGVSAE
jgi:acyl carrier protein